MNYSESPVKDPAAGRAAKASEDDVRRDGRLSRPVVCAIVVCAIVACALVAWNLVERAGLSPAPPEDVAEDAGGADGDHEAGTSDGVSTDAGSDATGSLGDATGLAVTADPGNGRTAGGLGADVTSATLARDEGGHGWVSVTFHLANPGSDTVTLGDGGLELLASQGDLALAWNSEDLATWNATSIAGGQVADVTMRFALADASEPLTLAVVRGGSTLGWTVDVADAASGIVPLGASA